MKNKVVELPSSTTLRCFVKKMNVLLFVILYYVQDGNYSTNSNANEDYHNIIPNIWRYKIYHLYT